MLGVMVLAIPGSAGAATLSTNSDFVTINAARGLSPSVAARLTRFAGTIGSSHAVFDRGTIDLVEVRRNERVLQHAPGGMVFPLDTLAVEPADVVPTIGHATSTALEQGLVAMSTSAAKLRHAAVGDRFTLVGWNGKTVQLTLGSVVPDGLVDQSELIVSKTTAATLGFLRPFSIRISGFRSRGETRQRIAAFRSPTPLRRTFSWINSSASFPMSQAQAKLVLGEFAMRRGSAGRLRIDPAWESRHLVNTALPIIGVVRCNRVVTAAAGAALGELIQQGHGDLIDARDSRVNGGCFSARDARAPIGTTGRNVSRHAWGGAIDINPSKNRFGSAGHMSKLVIAAFHRHGFAWGGHFLIPDPTHFEYAVHPGR